MNTLLNTISAQITYTRGALIALFAGLFILAACGGGAAPTVAPDGGTGTNVCDTNIFDPACGDTGQVKRTEAINTCITAIRTGGSCEVPTAVRDCLNAPFTTEGCGADVLRATVTIETVQATRTTDCRTGNAGSATCTGAIVSVCGEVSSTIDGVLFTETLCGDAYNARRSRLVTACVDAVEGGETREDSTACASVVISTDSAANEKALDCVLDPLGEGCDTNTDVMNVIEKTDDTIKSIDDEKTDRVAFCRGASNFAQNPLCMNAITTTCEDNPFTLTTGASPTNFCTGANDGRAALITRCSDTDTDCDKVVSGDVTLKTCVDTPYAAGCGDAVFNGLKDARYTHCIGETPTEPCDGVEANVICVADIAKADDRADPFAAVCRNAGATYTQQQTDFCTARASDNLPECATGLLTTCAVNPFEAICLAVDFYTADRAGHIADCIADAVTNKADCDMVVSGTTSVADCITDPFNVANGCNASPDFLATRTSRTSLCTPSATFFDALCNNYDGIEVARDGICETEATSFHVGCLGRTDGVALAMRKAFIQTCLATPSTDCDVPTSSLSHTVAQCIINPHREECKDDLDFAEVKSSRTMLCTDTALYFNPLCNTYEDIANTRETRCTVGATSFDTICDGKGYDEARDAGQEAFAVMCRGDSSIQICKDTKINASGSISVADCVNSVGGVDLAGDPWHPNCPPSLSFVVKERIERDRDCADIQVLGSSRCNFAKNFNLCVKDPFGTDIQGEACDADVYKANRDNRDTHCLGSEIADDPLCVGRKAYICDGTEPLGNPFATLCGNDNHDNQIAFCGANARTDGVCSNDRATVCPGNPFNDAFGANELDCTISAYYEYRRPACSGAKNTWSAVGASVDYCSVEEVAGVICGTADLTGTDAFADICQESAAMMAITNFNQVTEREQFCGDTRKEGARMRECGEIYTGLCTGANLVKDSVGMGGFDCLGDNDSDVVGLREDYCTTPASSFNPGCKDGTHGTVLDTRKNLAMTCRTPQAGTDCDTRVNGSDDNGLTVAQCSGAGGDAYHADCRANAELIAAFEDERNERALLCALGATVTIDALCKNAREHDTCIRNPYGKITDNSAECNAGVYAFARAQRVTHCKDVDATMDTDKLCNNVVAIFCDGIDDPALGKDDPFALSCDTIDADNSANQRTWCGQNSGDTRCGATHVGACSVRPFATNAVSRSGDPVNCLGDEENGVTADTYAPHRLEFCATGRQGATDSNCDTTIIAPVVCANSQGENANPFADFCEDAANDGQDAAALLVTRQATVARCAMSENSDMPVCVKSRLDIVALDLTCGDGATSVTAECDYEKYSTTQKAYCTSAVSDTVFDGNCMNGKHGEVRTAREEQCKKTGSVLFKNAEACTQIVIDICTANDIGALTPKGSGGHLCTDESGDYALARERACGADGRGAAGNLPAACEDTVERLCVEEKLIETEVGAGRLDCSTNDVSTVISARQNYCALTANAGKPNCAPTLTTLCTDENGMSLVQTASNGYDCSASRIDTVLAERRRFCANPEGGDTTGCPVVLADLCKGADSLLNDVATGGGVTYDCKDDGDDLVLYQRQVHCAQGTNDNGVGDCSAVLTTLCMEGDNSVQSQVTTTAGLVSYDCSTSTVPTVITARETLCQTRGNGDGLCTDTITNFCGTDENPHPTNDIFDLLCRAGYETARDNFCANDAEYENTDCDNDGRKDGICDGEQDTDKPYADVCGPDDTNLAGQTAFCRLNDHSTSVMKCRGTIVTVCDVGTGNPFDALCPTGDNTDRQTRATACFNNEKTGTDCKDVDECNGAPFGTNLAGQACDDTIYLTARKMVCQTPMTSFTVGCVNGTHGEVTKAQRGYCAGDVERHQNCPTLLAKVCMGENSLMNDVPTGHPSVDYDCKDDITTEAVINQRQAHCADPKGGVTTGCPDVLTMLCTGENSLSDTAPTGVTGTTFDCADGDAYRPQKREYCARDGKDGTGDCPSVITTLCADDKSVQIKVATGVDSRDYNCSTSEVANVVSAREAFCRENTGNNLCTTTIVGLCSDNEFELKADGETYVCGDELIGDTNYQETREATCENELETSRCKPTIKRVCGTATAIIEANFKNPLCSGSDYIVERGRVCSEISDKTERETKCGLENGDGDLAAYCNTDDGAGNDTVCPLTYNDGTRRACIDTNPFDGSCDEEFHDNRVRACRAEDKITDNKMANTSNCASTVVLICEGGNTASDGSSGEDITANPFDTLCNEGTDYDDERLRACEGDPANLPSGDVTLCKDAKLSGMICGTGENSASTHGSNPYADICNQPTALINNFDLTVARGTFCTEFSYNNNCVDNAAVKWKDTAKTGADGLTDLDVLSADGVAETNPATNYILGQIDELNLGFDQAVVPNTITGFQKGDLKLADLDSMVGAGNGVAFATFINSDFADVAGTSSKQRFYAGLLSNTDLGAPLDADNTISTVWKAKAAIIVGTNDLVRDELFTLDVIFGANTITTRAGDPIDEFGNNISFVIDGKFNNSGVIFGTTTYTNSAGSPISSTGSLTGLIGKYGAVGAFISDSSNAAGDFAGGFVADNPNTGTIDCLATGIPFNKDVCPNAGDLRAELCRKRVALTPSGLPLDFDVMTDCVADMAIVDAICARSGKSANPFDMVVCVGRDQTENQLAFVNNCANTDKTDLDEATCSGDIMRCIADPFDPSHQCGGAEYAKVRMTREAFCAFDKSPFDGSCANVPNIKVARGKACADGNGIGDCGNETTPGSYIEAYCDDPISANDVANCGKAYEEAQNAVDAVSPTNLQGKALNARGTDLLTGVVVSGNASDDNDSPANFITAGTTTLNFGSEGVPSIRKGDLALNALANSDLATSGFAFAKGVFDSGEKLYVGLLNSTNLGAPLSNGTKDGDWKTRLSVLTNTGEPVTVDFTLVVNFADKDINVKATPTVGNLGTISIAGKFTVNGVIYGTVNFTEAGGATLTGLIGTNGAVGIFASDSTSNTDYVGGFVAAHIDCTETGTPFDVDCGLDTPEQLSLCGGTIAALRNAGGELGRCQRDALSGMICGMDLVPGTNPFAEICIKSEAVVSGFNVVVARQVFCAGENIASPSSDCMPVISTLCTEQPFNATAGEGAMTIDCTTGDTYDSERDLRITTCRGYIMGTTTPENRLCEQSGVTAITATCTLNPFASVCAPYKMQYASAQEQRITDCRDVTEEAGLDCSGTQDVVCVPIGGTPISFACNGYSGNSETITAVRQEFCRDPLNAVDSRCTPIRKAFCDPLIGMNAILTETLCTDMAGTYDIARGAQCVMTESIAAAAALDSGCGTGAKNETELGSGYLQAFCNTRAGGSSEVHCKAKFDEVAAFVDTPDWEDTEGTSGARNFDNSGRLTILESVGADDTNDTNYVRAGASELDLGVFDSTTATITDGVLMLLDAGTTDALGSGVAFARINYDQFTSASKVKYYAGILSGTDLGGPVATSDVDAIVEWDLVLSILIDGTLERATAKLSINLGDRAFQKITNKQVKKPTPGIPFGSVLAGMKFFITGGYTTEGIIYGTTGIGANKDTIVSDGTLTGLIGSKGAVAAFVSDGVNNTGGEYVGGFVADNPAITPDCSLEGGNAFDPNTCPLSVRLPLCRDRDEVSVTTADCKTAEIRGVVCTTTGNYASLVDKICDGGDYETAREDAFCVDLATGGQANPFHPVCLAPMVADMYDVFRQTACDGQPVDVPSSGRTGLNARCNDPIIKLCEADPFNPAAGAGTVTFNCRDATDSNYVLAREAEIAFCADETKSTDSRCMQSTVSMITTDCRRDPLDSICADYPAQYRAKGAERIITCRGDSTERGGVVCIHALPTICMATDTPFSDLCSDYLVQRKNAVDTCLGSVIDNQPLPAICNVVVSNNKTVENCIADPFDTDCFADFSPKNCEDGPTVARCQNPFYAASARICETSNTSFTAGCLVPANGFVPAEERTRLTRSQTARRNLLQRCATDTTMNTDCDIEISGNVTLRQCIANPFDINCRGDAVAFALANSKDAVAIRTTLVARCADSDNTDRTNCDTPLAAGKNIEFCIATPFDTDCFGGHVEAAFDIYRADDCTTAETSFKAGCTEDSYNVTEAGEVIVKYTHTARAELALGCAVDSTGTGCDSVLYDSVGYSGCSANINAHKNDGADISTECAPFVKYYDLFVMCTTNKVNNSKISEAIIAGCPEILNGVTNALDVAFCSVNPFAPICIDRAEFLHARLESCKGTDPHATCSAEGALARTNYVAGDVADLDLGGASGGLIKTHTSTLNDVGYADTDDGVYDDQSASGFALAYIPEVREGQRVTSPSRYYAGLLSGTDVGGPLRGGFATAKWAGKLTIIDQGGELSATEDFTLDVDFDTRTIGASDTRTFPTATIQTYIDREGGEIVMKTRIINGTEERDVDYAVTTLGLFYINGRFTDQGVIYGTTRLVSNGGFRTIEPNSENGLTEPEVVSVPGAESSRGTLTGVIGQNGAVGAFVSSGSGNTFGEYAGGFVAAPGLKCDDSVEGNTNPINPLDIRCNEQRYYEVRENACSGLRAWMNPACDPVFERVCAEGDNALLTTASYSSSFANLDCLNAPKIHEQRVKVCGRPGGDLPVNGMATERCRETVATVCNADEFHQLCYGITVYEQMVYNTCSAIPTQIFDGSIDFDAKSDDAKACNFFIETECNFGDDPFENRFCYISDNYDEARLEKCSDHNFAATQPACTEDVTVAGATTGTVNVIKTYCDGLSGSPDIYNLCGNTADYVEWRNADNDAVTGWNAADVGDSGIIAGGETGLDLGVSEQAETRHNEITLTLGNTATSVFIASAYIGNRANSQLQSYGALLSGADVGTVRPISVDNVSINWSASIALLWQDGGDATRTTILQNSSFALNINFAQTRTRLQTSEHVQLFNTSGERVAKINFINITGEAGKKLLSGTLQLIIGQEIHVGDFRGLIGNTQLLGAFASRTRTGDNAFAGGLVAKQPIGTCVPDGTGNPFRYDNRDVCSDAQRQNEATRCYNERGKTIQTGDCFQLSHCISIGAEFTGNSFAFNTDTRNIIECDSPIFDGMRAVYCRDNPTDSNCDKLAKGEVVATTDDSDGSRTYNVCVGRPFTGNATECSDALGSVAFAQARLALAVDCMTGNNIATKAETTCKRFIASVKSVEDGSGRLVADCTDNPFSDRCPAWFDRELGSSYFVDVARNLRLAHCNADDANASNNNGLCASTLRHCAVAVSPHYNCGTLVTDYCLGGAARTIGDTGVCATELATTCEMNPFDDFKRCKVEQKYITARLDHCNGITTVAGLDLTACKTTDVQNPGLDLTICGDGTPDNVGTNPFAGVCDDPAYNIHNNMLTNAQKAYCGDSDTDLDLISDCNQFVATTCGVGGFGYTTNPNNAFDPLCRQDTYNQARFAACGLNPAAGDGSSYARGCTDFLLDVCPTDGRGKVIGCDKNPSSTPVSVWVDNAKNTDGETDLEIEPEGGITQGGGTVHKGAFAQAGLERLDLSAFGNPAQYKLTLPNDPASGVAFASPKSTGGGIQYFVGLLRGTNVGGPLVNNTVNGNWTAKVSLAVGTRAPAEIGFTLNVAFTGNGGTIKSSNDFSVDDAASIFNGVRMRISGEFNAEGVIYGTTDLYHTSAELNYGNSAIDGTLTGLIGKTSAVAAFYGIDTDKISNISQYVGGFVATPTTLYAEGVDCSATGTPLDVGTTDTPGPCRTDVYTDDEPRAAACNELKSFGADQRAVCQTSGVQDLICTGDGPYANPFNLSFCVGGENAIMLESLYPFQLAVVNRCDADITSAAACKTAFVTPCLLDPYSVTCRDDDDFADVRTNRITFCGLEENGDDPKCGAAVATCAANSPPAECGTIVSSYCLAGENRTIGGSKTPCEVPIDTACLTVNPFSPRCTDSLVAKDYTNVKGEFCSSQTLAELATLGADLAADCKPHAPDICGHYIAFETMGAGRIGNTGNRYNQPEVRVIGTNPFAEICTNRVANPDRPQGIADYTLNIQAASAHAVQIRDYYRARYCHENTSNTTRNAICPKIVITGADGYEAWKAQVGDDLTSVGDAFIDTGEVANFIAGRSGNVYLGIRRADVAHSKTFRLNAGANGFAYAATGVHTTGTGTQLFTGLLAGTTNLGAAFVPTTVSVKWRSTLSFLTLQGGVITAIEKEGFILNLVLDNTTNRIRGIENVAEGKNGMAGMVFQVEGTFTGNLLSGTVTFGATEIGTPKSKAFAASGDRTTGILTGIIGEDGVIGVFKSNASGGTYGHFAGGFIGAPAVDATDTVWALSFEKDEGNFPPATTPTGMTLEDNQRVKLHFSGVDITNAGIISDGAHSFIRLNANNEIVVNGGEFTLFNPTTGLYEFGYESVLNARPHGRDAEGNGLAVESDKTIRLSLAFFNNSGLKTPDNGASGVSFGDFKRAEPGSVRLAGLWSTTNMGRPLKAEPSTAFWQGKISALYAGKYTGERDARFVIAFNGPGGTIKTITKTQPEIDAGDILEGIFLFRDGTSYDYLNIDAKFDEFGAVSGTTTVGVFELVRARAPKSLRAGAAGRVSGLIGEKGLIGAFVSTADVSNAPNRGRPYLGGFYALNPDAPRSEEAGAPTSFGTWENSILQGGSSYAATEEMAATDSTPFIPAFPGLVERTVDTFGVGAPDKLARFARLGISDYIADDGTGNSQVLLADFADETVKNNGVGFGRVGNGYYSGLLAGADVGLSLTANQAITPGSLSATWTGKIALYGHGNGLGGNNHAPSFTPRDFSLRVIFDGTGSGDTAGEIIVDSTYEFGASIDTVHPFKLTITDVRFNAAGVITGTTSLFATPGNVQGHAVKGVLTGLIGTRGAIGSFISTGAIGTVAGGITYAGSYAGGFVVQNPDYTVTPEIPVLESGDLGGDVKYVAWKDSFASDQPSTHGTLQDATLKDVAGTYFIEATNNGIAGINPNSNDTLTLNESDGDGTFTLSKINGVAYGTAYNDSSFASLWSGANLGGALKSPPTSAVWSGRIGAVRGVTNIGDSDFHIKITFEGPGGTVKSSNKDGVVDTVKDYQRVNDDNRYRFVGTFTAAGVMTGTVAGSAFAAPDGTFNGIIGIKGAIGVFKSNPNPRADRRYIGGFTASNPDFGKQGVTADYNLWRVSFNSSGVNRQVTHPIITDTKLANPLHPRGVNVNQFVNGTTHFVQGELDGLNLTGSSVVTGGSFTPTVLKLADGKSGFALWQGNINISGDANIQGYVGLLNGTDVGADPLVRGRTTYTGKIQAYVGSVLSPETDFTLNINYGANTIDAVAELEGTRFQFDGGFNFLGVISGNVLIGADGVPGSFNGLLGTESAIGVFKNTVDSTNTGKTFIGGFAVSDKFINSPDWAKSFASGGVNTAQTLLNSARDDRTAGTHFISATASGIRSTTAEENLLHLTADDLDGGVAFVQEVSGAGYTGLLSTTNVGLPLELPTGDDEISAVWNGAIQAYVGGVLSGKSGFNLMVNFMDRDVDGTVTLGGKKFTFDGDFTDKGIMHGEVSIGEVATSTVQGSFNGLIGVLGAAGAFKNDDGAADGTFVGGFVVTPVLDTDDKVNFDDWQNSGVSGLLAVRDASTQTGNFRQGFFIRGTAASIHGIEANTRILTLTSDIESGIAFGHRPHDEHRESRHQTTYYAGLLSGTDVGRHIDNKNLNGVWKGRIQSYVLDGDRAGAVNFFLDVEFGASGLTGNEVGKVRSTSAVTNGTKGAISLGTNKGNIDINGTFNAAGVMSGTATHVPYANNTPVTSHGTFTGLIGTLGAVGVFKDNGNGSSGQPDAFLGGFIAEPTE